MKYTCGVFFVVLALAGCGTSPEPDYYTLHTVSGDAAPVYTETIRIERPSLAGYLDRPGMVRQSGDSMTIDEGNRWAEPLDTMFERILADDLRQRLPASTIVTDQDGSTVESCLIVDSDIEQMNRADDGYALNVIITISDRCMSQQPRQMPVTLHQDSGDTTTTISKLIGLSTDQLAAMLRNYYPQK